MVGLEIISQDMDEGVGHAKKTSHYDTLGVPQDAPQSQIKEAFHKLARKYHPDRIHSVKVAETGDQGLPPSGNSSEGLDGDGKGAHDDTRNVESQTLDTGTIRARYRAVQEAWDCLNDPVQKRKYDSDLYIRKCQSQAKQQSAIPIDRNDCHEVLLVDEEDDDEIESSSDLGEQVVAPSLLYECRCGEELLLEQKDDESTLVDCPGCSVTYDIRGVWR